MIKSPLDYNHKNVEINGYNYHYVDEGNQNGELLIFVNGWPELWICSKYQIEYFTQLGYRVIAVDLIGLGGSEGPNVTDIHNLEAEGLSNYTIKSNCEALRHLVKEVLKKDQAIFIGHDWGSRVVFRMSQFFPDVVKALASSCINYELPQENWVELDDLVQNIPAYEYQKDIAYGKWESECKENKSTFFKALYQYKGLKEGVQLPPGEHYIRLNDVKSLYQAVDYMNNYDPVFNEQEFEYILEQFTNQKISNSCNYYRTRLLNYKDDKELIDKPYINHPTLMIHATNDPTNKFWIKNGGPPTKKYCTKLTHKIVEGDHCIPLNTSNEVNEHIKDWLISLNL